LAGSPGRVAVTATLAWIVSSGLVMSILALSGSLTLVLPQSWFDQVVLPLVALAAGSLLGGALFVMVPAAITQLGNSLTVYVALTAGVVAFHLLEQFLHWHHCHRAVCPHAPVGTLVLVADAVHNLIGGLAVGSAFVIDIRLGVVTWLVAAAHEVPQELGDFGILVHSGFSRRSALGYNMLSALTFLLGGLVAYAVSASLDVAVLVPFAAGTFIYIALADLVPEITTSPDAAEKAVQTASFLAGLGLLLAVAVVTA
jgi:zinc and cadmium transporter